MSIIENSGLKTPAIATERGWESPDGKLIIASRNLLTNRVLRNLATPSELKSWADIQFIDIEFRENKIQTALAINKKRLDNFDAIFESDTLDIANSSDTLVKIQYLLKKVEHLKIVAEYEKSFAAMNKELEGLNNKRQNILSRISPTLKTTEVLSEKSVAPQTDQKIDKQKDKSDKPSEPEKVEVQKKKRKGRFGPKPGWKLRKAEAEAEALRKKLEESNAASFAAVQTLPTYPVAEDEILD